MRKTKNILAFMLSCIMMLSLPSNIYASMREDDRPYFIVNGNTIVYADENYENPETGEYFRWTTNVNARGEVIKTFEFLIQFSVTSSKFTVTSSKVSVSASASIVNGSYDVQSGHEGHQYHVTLIHYTSFDAKTLNFSIGGTESGTITGLSSGGSYKITIANDTYMSSQYYLSGSGSIKEA